jgi:hypothetical protein
MSEFPTPKSKFTFTEADRDHFESDKDFLKRMQDNEPSFHEN